MDAPKKEMSEATKQLLAKLEDIIGNSCYNTSAKNFAGRDELDDGRWIRYPITVQYNGKPEQFRRKLPPSVLAKDDFLRARYVAGVNHFYVVQGLFEVLQYLEKHHGLKLPDDPPPTPRSAQNPMLKRIQARAKLLSESSQPDKKTP